MNEAKKVTRQVAELMIMSTNTKCHPINHNNLNQHCMRTNNDWVSGRNQRLLRHGVTRWHDDTHRVFGMLRPGWMKVCCLSSIMRWVISDKIATLPPTQLLLLQVFYSLIFIVCCFIYGQKRADSIKSKRDTHAIIFNISFYIFLWYTISLLIPFVGASLQKLFLNFRE